MKNYMKSLFLFTLCLAVLAWAPSSWAQLKKLYDPQKVVTIQGQIEKLETITRQGRQANNGRKTQIAYLKTAQGTKIVHLGPAEFLAQLQFLPKTGDTLTVTGGKVDTRRQGEVILATSVSAGGKIIQLRDARGIPVWTGQTPGCYGQGQRRS